MTYRRLLVCGGRKYRSAAVLFRTLEQMHKDHGFTHFIQGGATGADRLAKEWAMTHPEIKRYESKAKWEDLSHLDARIKTRPDGSKYDANAGHRRNARMIEWKPDLVVAFPGGDGTADMVKQAKAANIMTLEVQ